MDTHFSQFPAYDNSACGQTLFIHKYALILADERKKMRIQQPSGAFR
jgi:hypothetical protein